MRHLVAILVDQLEWAAHLGLADALGRLGYPLALHPLLLALKVPHQAGAGDDEEQAGLPREGLPKGTEVSRRPRLRSQDDQQACLPRSDTGSWPPPPSCT